MFEDFSDIFFAHSRSGGPGIPFRDFWGFRADREEPYAPQGGLLEQLLRSSGGSSVACRETSANGTAHQKRSFKRYSFDLLSNTSIPIPAETITK